MFIRDSIRLSQSQVDDGSADELYTISNVLNIDNESSSLAQIGRVSTQISNPELESSIVRHGSHSVKFTLNATGTNSWGIVDLPLDGVGTYNFSFWYYSVNGDQRIDAITNTNQGELFLDGAVNQWNQVNINFDVTDAAATTSVLRVGRGNAGSVFYLDGFALSKQAVSVPSPIIDLPFNGNSNDVSGFNRTVTELNSPTFLTESSRSFIRLDGVDQKIVVSQSSDFLTDDFTWEVEFRPLVTSGSFKTIIERNRQETEWTLLNKNNISATIKFRSASGGSRDTSDFSIVQDTWYKVVVSVSGNNVKVFINGVKEFDDTRTVNTPRSLSDIHIGGNMSNSEYFNMDVSLFKMYDVALTDAQSLSLFN